MSSLLSQVLRDDDFRIFVGEKVSENFDWLLSYIKTIQIYWEYLLVTHLILTKRGFGLGPLHGVEVEVAAFLG
jgi:hypothetical protein